MTGFGHGRLGAPLIRLGIVRLIFVKGAFPRLAAEHVNLSFYSLRSDAGACRRQGCVRFPLVRLGIVGFVGVEIVIVVDVDAPADGKEQSICDRYGEVIARWAARLKYPFA